MSQEPNAAAPQPLLSPETLLDGPWFENVKRAYEVRTKPSHPPKWLVPVIGFSIAGLLWLLGYRKTAIVGGSIVAVMFLLEFVHPATARKVQKGLAIFGAWVGQAIGWLLLCPMFLIVGPLSRVFTRVMGADPLGRRMADAPSYWHFGSPENARTKKTASMFCVERKSAGGRNWLGALALLGIMGLIAGELVPKTLALNFPERFALVAARPLAVETGTADRESDGLDAMDRAGAGADRGEHETGWPGEGTDLAQQVHRLA